eukprot:m.49803 g.49803  ORF g.49803 m.49803 type:complete len:52 (-) comp11517_c0_seq4:998-1153(-)
MQMPSSTDSRMMITCVGCDFSAWFIFVPVLWVFLLRFATELAVPRLNSKAW